MKTNKIKIILATSVVLIIGAFGFWNWKSKENVLESDMDVVLTLESEIQNNAVWCGTINLVWNDLKEYIGSPVIVNPAKQFVNDLNKSTFVKDYLSEEDYYIKSGIPTFSLKKEIEDAILKKFQEKSSILDSFEWDDKNADDYFLYAMLKKNFEFETSFEDLGKSKFHKTPNVSYFGTSGEKSFSKQITILYYNNEDDFAIKLHTKGKDEVILARGITGHTFKDFYEQIENQKNDAVESFKSTDSLKIPYMNFHIKKEFDELANLSFQNQQEQKFEIGKALQTIEFELDETGGKLKSEAGMSVNTSSLSNPRNFHFDDTFVLFLKEKNQAYPYFGMYVSDISKVQLIQ